MPPPKWTDGNEGEGSLATLPWGAGGDSQAPLESRIHHGEVWLEEPIYVSRLSLPDAFLFFDCKWVSEHTKGVDDFRRI